MGVLGGVYALVEEILSFGLMEMVMGCFFFFFFWNFYDTNGVNDNDELNFNNHNI